MKFVLFALLLFAFMTAKNTIGERKVKEIATWKIVSSWITLLVICPALVLALLFTIAI